VFGGFGLAVLFGLPIGLLIGRVPVVRQLLDPTPPTARSRIAVQTSAGGGIRL
jgi:ABC-type nitrate/sulfonate/bicarbonate transport system permease component